MNKFYDKLSQDIADTHMEEIKEWSYDNGGISRTFNFVSYDQTMNFVNQVAAIANAINHHPDIHVSFKSCKVYYITHAVSGLSMLDFISASRLDALSKSNQESFKGQ